MRRNHWFSLLFGVLLILSVLVVQNCNHEPTPRLDHFKVYKVVDQQVDERVRLRGQFDESWRGAHLTRLTGFANPVSKNGSAIIDTTAHLVWYALEQEESEPSRTVTFRNQFGRQEWVLGQPQFLLVPAEKNSGGFPEKLDHYKAYEVLDVIGEPVEGNVSLVDQWTQQTTALRLARWFCVPVAKRKPEHEIERIRNHMGHLAVYAIEPMDFETYLMADHQFPLADSLKTLRSRWLCVPSRKRNVEE